MISVIRVITGGGMVTVHDSDVLSHAVVYTCYAREAQLSVC